MNSCRAPRRFIASSIVIESKWFINRVSVPSNFRFEVFDPRLKVKLISTNISDLFSKSDAIDEQIVMVMLTEKWFHRPL